MTAQIINFPERKPTLEDIAGLNEAKDKLNDLCRQVYTPEDMEREQDRIRYLERTAQIADLQEMYDGIVYNVTYRGWTVAEVFRVLQGRINNIKETL